MVREEVEDIKRLKIWSIMWLFEKWIFVGWKKERM